MTRRKATLQPQTLHLTAVLILLGGLLLTACSTDATPVENTPTPTFNEPNTATPIPQPTLAITPQTPQPTEAPTEIVSVLGVEEADLEGVELQFWHAWSWAAEEAIGQMVASFNATNRFGILVEVTSEARYGDLSQKVKGSLGTEAAPNLVVGFSNQIQSWDFNGAVVVDLNGYIQDPIWGYPEREVGSFYPPFWEQDVVAGKRIGLPAQRATQFLFYNSTWAQELGFENPPDTPEAFKEQACAAVFQNANDERPENDGTGGWVIDTSTATVLSWIFAFEGEFEEPDGYQFSDPQVEAALSYLKDLFDSGCAWIAQNRYPNTEFAERQALLISSSSTGIPFQEVAFQDAENLDEWTVIPFPTVTGQTVTLSSGPSFAMIKSSPEKQLATWLFLKWVLSPENQARWVEASGYYPSRQSSMELLEAYTRQHPQWATSLNYLPSSRLEPRHASWGVVRWAVSDAAEQIFRLGLTTDQIPALVRELDRTAAELHAQSR